MRWIMNSLALVLCLALGCGRQPAPKDDDNQPQVKVEPKVQPNPDPNEKNPIKVDPVVLPKGLFKPADADEQRAKYETALADALNLLADQKWPDALVALETARAFQDNDFIQGEIARVKTRIDQDAAALKTVQNLETILDEGKGTEAAKLARQALDEFGAGDHSPKLIKLRLQADALEAIDKKEDAQVRHQRYRDEGQAAVNEKNLRAAALAFEQALAAKDDAGMKTQLEGIRASLDKYDGLRKKANELRRDPAQLDDALDALRAADKAWSTLQVRQEIDEVSLALQNRRANVSVADFTVRGDVGLADAGPTIAEELLPLLKSRFDLVERGQINKIVGELKLEGNLADDFDGQRELGKLAKVRYLVVGSVSRVAGVTINARLVEVRTGLIAQTAKVAAPTAEDALLLLPELAKQLMMSDEEKLAYAQQQIQQVKRIEPVAVEDPLPAPPTVPAQHAFQPPPVFVEAPPPAFGGLGLQQFKALPPPPPPGNPLPPPVFGLAIAVKTKMLQTSLQLGDNLFRRGQHREAQRHFEFAFQLSPGHVDIGLRIERNAPFMPPPPPVLVVVERPVVIVRPRIAVLNFLPVGDPLLVAPALGPWTAQNLAPYFTPYYDVVDPAEVYWYMGRMGMTMRDLMDDPNSRRWLGRAVGVRYFVLGTVEFGSIDVNAYLLDAEFGYLQGSGRIVARNPFDLKLRLGELAQLTMIDPVQRARIMADADRFDTLMLSGRQSMDQRKYGVAIAVYTDALKLRPGHVQVSFYLNQARDFDRQFAWELERQRQLAARLAAEEAARRRQWELSRAAELACIRAAQESAAMAKDQRRLEEERRLAASNAMVIQARLAIQTKHFGIALNFFEGASNLRPNNNEVLRELAQARVEAERAAQFKAAQDLALREAVLLKQRDRELALARQQLELQRQREFDAAAAARKGQDGRDRLAYQTAFDDGQRLLNLKQYDGAIAAFQTARRFKKTDAVEALLSRALADQAYALAEAKGKDETAKLEKQLALERARRKVAEEKAKANQELYQAALKLAQQSLAQKDYAVAQAKYQEAGQLFQTDAVQSGLQQVKAAQALALADANATQRKTKEEATRTTRLKELVAEGQVALDIKDYAGAVQAYSQAKKLAPDNLDVLTGLTRAEQGQTRVLADARRKTDEVNRTSGFQKLLKNGQDNLAAKQYAAAAVVLQEALKLQPDDATAKAALAAAEKGRLASLTTAKDQDDAKKKTEAFQRLLNDGRQALDGKRYDDAIKAFGAAQKVMPGDKLSAASLAEAQQGKLSAQAALVAAAKKRVDEVQRAADLQKYLDQARAALNGKDLAGAAKSLDQAAKLGPTNADLLRAQKDLRTAQDQKVKDDAASAGRLASFQKLMDAGQQALKGKQYDQAAAAFGQALKLMPDDKNAGQLLKQAQKASTTAKLDGDKNQTDYLQAIDIGQRALGVKKYDEAIKSFTRAGELKPGDQKALQLLAQAQKARADAKTKTPDTKTPDPKTPTLKQHLDQGAALEKQQKYQDAIKAYQDAQALSPKDKQAADGLRRAELGLHVSEGQKHLDAKRYPEAIREFEAALVLAPNNPTVQKLLQKAKQGKK